MPTDEKDQPNADANEALPLAPGVWTETTGFAVVPPRCQSDLRHACDEESTKDPSSPAAEPRIEKYRER